MQIKCRHIVASIFVSIAGGLLLLWLLCLPRNLFEETSYSTVVTDKHGCLLGARVADDEQWRFPPSDTLPEKFVKALIEFEDRTFYRHHGVSVRALARATVQNIRNRRIVSGGSTLSMQVIRLSRQKPRTVWEKIVEIWLATRLEVRYSKEEILHLYAAHAPFGGNIVGIDAAMWRYLGSTTAELSWAEAATLAVLQNAPSNIHLTKNRDLLFAKRNRLLARLHQKGDISDEDYRLAIEEPLIGDPYPLPQYAPHLVEYYNQVRHGERCTTQIDITLQQRMERTLLQWSNELRQRGVQDLAAVIIDVHSGEIVAYSGNTDMDFQREGKWVDIARSPRSSGSILKPLLYAASLQNGTILPQTLLPDVPTDFGGFVPKNFDGTYAGAITADKALALSLNIPNVYLLKTYGILHFAQTLQQCGMQSLTRPAEEYGLSLILGGAEVTLLDIVSCYAKMAACYQDTSRYADFPLRNRIALYHTFTAMREVNRPDQMDWRRVSSMQPIAWKTGTSYGSRDAWAVGLTPEYAIGVWAGNASGSGVAGLTGARTAGPILFDLFGLLPTCEYFTEPTTNDGITVSVCAHSGYRASRHCADVKTMLLPHASMKSEVCPYCHEVAVSAHGRQRIADRSEPTHMASYFVLPPIMAHFYKPHHPEYKTLPPQKATSSTTPSALMRFIYPADGSVIALPRQLDGKAGSLVCKVAHTTPENEVFWHLDNLYLGTTRDLHQMAISPNSGTHTLTVVDATGATTQIEFAIL